MGNLHPGLQGLIVGFAIALVLYGLEYYLLKKQAKERAVRQHKANQAIELDATEKARLHSVRNMCAFVPVFFAAMYWLVA